MGLLNWDEMGKNIMAQYHVCRRADIENESGRCLPRCMRITLLHRPDTGRRTLRRRTNTGKSGLPVLAIIGPSLKCLLGWCCGVVKPLTDNNQLSTKTENRQDYYWVGKVVSCGVELDTFCAICGVTVSPQLFCGSEVSVILLPAQLLP